MKKRRKYDDENQVILYPGRNLITESLYRRYDMQEEKKPLNEDSKGQIISQAKNSDIYKNPVDGKNRYERRKRSKIASSVAQFNSIDMDKLFKADILDVNIDIIGQKNNYVVRVSFPGFLDELHDILARQNSDNIDRKYIAQALSRAFNSSDVQYNCTCPDFRFRHAYNATQAGNLVGEPENRPIRKDKWHAGGLDSANYYGNQGTVCKHITLVLKDTSWLIRVASVIYNYINYMKDHYQREYQKYIYPAIYQEPYPDEEVQLDISDIERPTTLEDGTDVSEYQQMIDNDMSTRGRISVATRHAIDKAGLSLVKNTDGSYSVERNRIMNTEDDVRSSQLDNSNREARYRGVNKIAANRAENIVPAENEDGFVVNSDRRQLRWDV